MTEHVIGWTSLGFSMVFVAFSVAITWRFRLGMEKSILVSVGRSVVQMLVVGTALVPIVRPSTPMIWSWLWVLVIVFFASLTTTRRAEQVPGLFPIALLANALVAALGIAIVFGLQIFELEGRTLVPVAGMLIGNTMKASVVGSMRVTESVAEHRSEIEAGLALGMTVREASMRFVRSSLRTAISPQVENTAALGIVFLPGTMTGLILAGVEPLEAVRAQLALMYIILSGVVIGSVTTGLGTLSRLTTEDERVLRLERRGTS